MTQTGLRGLMAIAIAMPASMQGVLSAQVASDWLEGTWHYDGAEGRGSSYFSAATLGSWSWTLRWEVPSDDHVHYAFSVVETSEEGTVLRGIHRGRDFRTFEDAPWELELIEEGANHFRFQCTSGCRAQGLVLERLDDGRLKEAWLPLEGRDPDERIWTRQATPHTGALPEVLRDWPTSIDAPRFSPDGRWIAFASVEPVGADLYLVEVASGEVRRLTDSPDSDLRPSWDPSGQRLVFQSDREGMRRLWVLSLTDGSLAPLTPPGMVASAPDWSPAGDLITFASDANGSWDVWVTQPDGRGARAVTVHEGNEYHPKFAPDGSEITFYSTWSNWTDLHVVSTAGGDPVLVLGSEHEDYRPIYDERGAGLYFASDRGEHPGLWWISRSGGEPVLVDTARVGRLDYPDLAPDGSALLHVADRFVSQLIETPIQGDSLVPLFESKPTTVDRRPAVSPDGTHLAYETDRFGNGNKVVVRNLRSGREVQIGVGRINVGSPRFSPDGRTLVVTRSGGDAASSAPFLTDVDGSPMRGWGDRTNVGFPSFCGTDRLVFAWSAVAYSPHSEVWMLEADGTARRIGEHRVERTGFSCDPTGRYLVVALADSSASDREVPRLVVLDLEAGTERVLTRSQRRQFNPRISADGTRVAFVEGAAEQGQAFWVPFEGGTPSPIGAPGLEVGTVVWSGRGRVLFDEVQRRREARLVQLPSRR